MKRTNYVNLVTYLFGAELRSDLNRYYLGTIWWFLEPCLYVAVFYLAFSHIRGGDEGFVYLLMCGIVTWKWLSSIIGQGASSLVSKKGLLTNFNIHPAVFPMAIVLTNTMKFTVILISLIVLLLVSGELNLAGWVNFLIWLPTCLLVVVAYTMFLSALMPFLPDLRIFVSNGLMLLLFVSGVIFPIDRMSEQVQQILVWNPFVHLIDGARRLLLWGQDLNLELFSFLALTHALLLFLSMALIGRLKGEIPKRLI